MNQTYYRRAGKAGASLGPSNPAGSPEQGQLLCASGGLWGRRPVRLCGVLRLTGPAAGLCGELAAEHASAKAGCGSTAQAVCNRVLRACYRQTCAHGLPA